LIKGGGKKLEEEIQTRWYGWSEDFTLRYWMNFFPSKRDKKEVTLCVKL
jgi:hypothetical protein